MEAATRRWRDFFLAWFMRGDELYHRGPLVGHMRSDAIESFQKAAQLRPDFAPAWEHLTWALTAEGNAASAQAAFDTLEKVGEPRGDPSAEAIRALLKVGLVWRFQGRVAGRRVTQDLLAQPGIASYPDLAAGPRYLPTFDAPQGAVELGNDFASRKDRSDLERSGLIARVFGYVALGRPDSALGAAARLADRFPDPRLAVLGPELQGTLRFFDPEVAAKTWPSARTALQEKAESRADPVHIRRRASWMLSLLSQQDRGGVDADRYRRVLEGEPAPRMLSTLVAASEYAAGGDRIRALAITDTLTTLSGSELAAAGPVDPFSRTVLHWLRAEWYRGERQPESARRELLWYQNNDAVGYPTGDPQVGDVDWAFGTLARWRLAGLLDGPGKPREAVCRAYEDVKRLWSQGEPRYRARADSASRRLASLKCGASP